MPSVNPSPFGPCPQFVDAAGDPAVGDQLFFYAAGTTTKQDTYTDSTGTVANTNPIVLDALGQPPEEVWFANGLIYKMVWAPSTDTDPPTNPIRTFDNLTGINDVQSLFSNSEWVISGLTPTYVSATQFEVSGNQTSLLTVGRRIKTENTSGTIYSTITDSVFGSVTAITVINDSGSLDSGLSSLDYGLISSVNPSLPNSQSVRNTMGLGSAQDIASTAALPLSTSLGNLVRITGTTATTSVVMNNGQQVACVAVGAWPLTYNASTMPIKGGASYTCAAGDIVRFYKDNSGALSVDITGVGVTQPVLDNSTKFATTAYADRAGGLAKLNSGTVSSAATLDIVMTSYTAYRNKILVFNLVPATTAVDLQFRVSTNGGSSYDSGASDYKYQTTRNTEDGTTGQQNSGGGAQSFIQLNGNTIGNLASGGISGQIVMYDTINTAALPRFQTDVVYFNASIGWARGFGFGQRTNAQDTDAVRLLFSSGNISSGTWALYGYT